MKIQQDLSMSSFDIYAIIKEIKTLENYIINNIYQQEKVFGFKLRRAGSSHILIMEPERRIHLTNISYDWKLTNFIQMIRKHLRGRKLTFISQYMFDRIVEINVDRNYKIILEILPRGNFIITKDNKVLFALKHVHMRDRAIYPGSIFKYPPNSPENPLKVDDSRLIELIKKQKTLFRGLIKLGLGPKYAYEISYRCGISNPEKTKINSCTNETFMNLINCMREIFNEIDKDPKPSVYLKDNVPYAFAPIRLESLVEAENHSPKFFQTFSQALDFYFSNLQVLETPKTSASIMKLEREKLLKRVEAQKRRIIELEEEINRAQKTIEIIYSNYNALEYIIRSIRRAKIELNMNWDEIIKKISKAKKDNKLARLINEIRTDGTIFVRINDHLIELNIRRNLHDIIDDYYSKIKKNREKLKIAREELKKTLLKLENIDEEIRKRVEIDTIIVKIPSKRWYDKFYWFISSNGFLVLGGKDAQTNEILVKKYMSDNDVFLHAEIHGGSVVLVKNFLKRTIPNETLYQAAIYAASYSKAWKMGLHNVDVFYTSPINVTLTPPSGQYLPAGSFIIKKKEYIRNVPLELSIGILLYPAGNTVLFQVISAPTKVIERLTKYYVTITPGTIKKSEIAKMILKKIMSIEKDNPYLLRVINNIKLEKVIDLIPGPSLILEEKRNE